MKYKSSRMKRHFVSSITSILVSLISLSSGLAQEMNIAVTLEDSFYQTQESEHVVHSFGGQEIKLPIEVQTSSREQINLKAKLTQVTFSLTAQHNIVPEISLPLEQENGARANREVKLELPTVQRETDFQLSFQAQTESQDLWSEAGIVQIRVYPKDLLAPLKNWSRKVQLRLDDREGILEYLLATQEVAFVDSRAQMKKLEGVPVVTMIVKNTQKVLLPRRPLAPHNSIIVFNEQVENVPKVVVTPFGTGRLIQVDLQIIKRLSEDPRAQKQFMEIIQLAHPVP